MKALLIILHSFISTADTLPPQHILEASIDAFYAQKAQVETTEYKITTKFDWMKWLPSVGIGYALDGKPRPVANYSIDRFYTNAKTKETNKLKIETLQRTAILEAQKLKFEVRILLKKYALMATEITFMQQNLTLEDDIFTIETDKYNRHELRPAII
jgi:hypothetical protein